MYSKAIERKTLQEEQNCSKIVLTEEYKTVNTLYIIYHSLSLQLKTEPDEFEDEDKKPLEDIVKGERFNAYVEKVKTQSELQIRF